MTSWIVNALDPGMLENARTEASRRLLNAALGKITDFEENRDLCFVAEAMELAVVDLLNSDEQLDAMRSHSSEAFQLLRVMPRPESPLNSAEQCLRLACLGVLGERGMDAARILKEDPWPTLPLDSDSWRDRTLSTILDIWLRLIRKDGWADLEKVLERVVALRQQQQDFEANYLDKDNPSPLTAAWELILFYHLAKAAELLATYTTQGQVDGHFDIRQQLESQFDRAVIACGRAELVQFDAFTRILARVAQQLVDNSIWTVTRAVNSRVTRFVQHLVSHEQRRPIFEMLPPQRRALREAGLLGSGHRAVVVNLPTSSGKTFIAQFRILQAINQFDQEQGWVAYLAPTRALVNQICTRLRRDFAPLNLNVERVSPALEVDGLEASLLTDADATTKFRVLVTTPEKLDLMLRGGWEEKIGRPLTLVVVDEAHNIAQSERGIKLELLLATINRECRYAQFLLLTPFITNAAEIAKWLSPDSNTDIELELEWQPNDRAIVLSRPKKEAGRGNFSVQIETIHTTKQTIEVPERLPLGEKKPLGLTCSAVSNNFSKLAAATAQGLKSRGSVIVLARTIPHAWSLAANFKHPDNASDTSDDVRLVQRYLGREFGKDFELCRLLEYGVGVHHSGLSDEARVLMEWLFEQGHIKVLVATTTIAQGVNFPVSGIVMAAHQYPGPPPVDMPPGDFWNLAGRAGRVDQGSLGIVALAAKNDESAAALREFVNRQVLSLNSTLVTMVQDALAQWGGLQLHLLYAKPEWSAFLQYLAHTYRQIGDPFRFSNQVEQVLRGTLGFQSIRRTHADWANQLVASVQAYGERIAGKSLKLVDTTGFSWESISVTLRKLADERISEDVWDAQRLFSGRTRDLQKLMGILLAVPELRKNLEAATGGRGPDGQRLAEMVVDWVNGASLPDMARRHFAEGRDTDAALTECCKNVYGKLAQTASWGLAALQAMTLGDRFDELSESEQQSLRNLPARVFYGVNTDEAIALRLLGVPRGAAQSLASTLGNQAQMPLPHIRASLSKADASMWSNALGESGSDYFQVWKILEGLG